MVDIQWDPVLEARLLRRWALLALAVAVLGFTPINLLLLGLSGFQVILTVTLAATYTFVAIELVTRWDYRMRRRYAYPHRLGYELATIPDFSKACEQGAELVGKWLGAKAAVVAWLSEDRQALLPMAAYGLPPSWIEVAPHVPLDPDSLREALREGRPLDGSSVGGDRWFESIGNREPIIYVPLVRRERPEGVLAVAVGPGNSETRDQRLLAALGMVMGLALDNSRLYEGQRARAHHLQQINRMKSDFLTTVSHELRTPLTSIKVAGEMLLEEEEREAAEGNRVRLVRNIVKGASRLTSLVADLVNVSRDDEFQPRLELDETPLGDIVASAAAVIQPLVVAKGQNLEIRVATQDTDLLVDRLRFEQVLINLLSNAQRYTPAGGLIEVSSRIANGEVIVAVTDSGPGVALEDRERIFEPFYRGDRSGLGLGLAIAKSLVELHNGRIWVESSDHGGSSFCVALPRQRTANVRPLDPISASL
jgi:signal transduction histidine kinase